MVFWDTFAAKGNFKKVFANIADSGETARNYLLLFEEKWSGPICNMLESTLWNSAVKELIWPFFHLCIFQEIPENGADVAHFSQVHGPVIATGIDLTTMWNKYFSFAWHNWTAQWSQNPAPEEHIGSLRLTHDLQLFGFSSKVLFMTVLARQVDIWIFVKNNCPVCMSSCVIIHLSRELDTRELTDLFRQYLSYSLTKSYVVVTQKNRLTETIL